jgi:hypothetical protein
VVGRQGEETSPTTNADPRAGVSDVVRKFYLDSQHGRIANPGTGMVMMMAVVVPRGVNHVNLSGRAKGPVAVEARGILHGVKLRSGGPVKSQEKPGHPSPNFFLEPSLLGGIMPGCRKHPSAWRVVA